MGAAAGPGGWLTIKQRCDLAYVALLDDVRADLAAERTAAMLASSDVRVRSIAEARQILDDALTAPMRAADASPLVHDFRIAYGLQEVS